MLNKMPSRALGVEIRYLTDLEIAHVAGGSAPAQMNDGCILAPVFRKPQLPINTATTAK